MIYGGSGDDYLWGGPGSDTFVFHSNQPGIDFIMDFERGDRINVRGVDGWESGGYAVAADSTVDAVNNALALLSLENFPEDTNGVTRLSRGSVIMNDAAPGARVADSTVAIVLNGVSESALLSNDYMQDFEEV